MAIRGEYAVQESSNGAQGRASGLNCCCCQRGGASRSHSFETLLGSSVIAQSFAAATIAA